MLIEAAFYKLPEVLTSRFDHADTYEGSLLSSFVACVMMELNARNIPNAYEHIHTEKPYPTSAPGERRWRADLLLKLEGAVDIDGRRQLYGMREQAWVELKGFFESTRSQSTPPKTALTGLLLHDILRVCLLPEELPGRIRQNARYVLVVLANPPHQSLSFGGPHRSRGWLESLFRDGHSTVDVDLRDEPESLRAAAGKGFSSSADLQVHLKVRTHVFEPQDTTPSPVFWGYLVHLNAFRVVTPVGTVDFDDRPGDEWPDARVDALRAVRAHVVHRIRSAEPETSAV
jgi:hypothetical protein